MKARYQTLVTLFILGCILGYFYYDHMRYTIPSYIKEQHETLQVVFSEETIEALRNSSYWEKVNKTYQDSPEVLLYYVGEEIVDVYDVSSPTHPLLVAYTALRYHVDRHNPMLILQYGVGGAEEFAIVYAAYLQAGGRDARLVYDYSVSLDPWLMWVEYLDDQKTWVHVDPKRAVLEAQIISNRPDFEIEDLLVNEFINNPFLYERELEISFREVWAFNAEECVKVTKNYKWEG